MRRLLLLLALHLESANGIDKTDHLRHCERVIRY